MSTRILFLILLSFSFRSNAQDAKSILKESYSNCLTVKNGYYESDMKWKFMDSKDTTWQLQYKVYFKKIMNDPLYPIAFNFERFYHKTSYVDNTLYTGKEYVTYSLTDSSAKIMAKSRWINDLMSNNHKDIITFYGPLTNPDCSPLPADSDYSNRRIQFKFIDKVSLNNKSCYHVQMVKYPDYDSTQTVNTILSTYDFWINSDDMIPVKYSITSKLLQFTDTLTEYRSYSLEKYHLNDPQNLVPLQLSAIPAYCNIKDYVERKTIPLLKKGTSAPEFSLTSLQSEPFSLSKYKGQLVLIDFFFKSCYPCVQAIPGLESLLRKYKMKGLTIIGIDAVDKDKEALKHFVSISGISYPIFIDEGDVSHDYQVTSCPTLYLINKQGEIIFVENGFDESSGSELENIIKDHL